MTWRAAIWTVALVISLGVHAILALAVSGLRGAAPGVVLAELRIADDAGFAVTVVRPVAQPPKADVHSADAIKSVAAIVLPPAASPAAEQIKAAGAKQPLAPVASDGAILPAAPGEKLADAVPVASTALQPVAPQSATTASSAGAVQSPVAALAEQVPAEAAPAEHLKAAGPERPLSPVASAGAIAPAAPGVSVATAVPAPADSSGVSQPGAVPSAALPGVAAQKLPPVTQHLALAPATLAPASLAERMRDFVRIYDGGACFFAVPVSFDDQRPRIDGFGSDAEPILAFGAELRRALGIDAEIVVRQITGEQCPAIGFIGGLLKSRLPELLVQLADDSIASGQELRGTVAGAHLPWLSLFLVDDDGMVHDISTYLSQTQDGWSFAAPLYVTAQGRERNQLIVAIAASRALDRLKLSKPAAGSELFPAVVSEAEATQNDIAIGIGAFRVE